MDAILRSLLHDEVYSFSPAEERKVFLKKERTLVQFQIQDEWVNQELGGILKESIEPTASASLLSYFPGRGPHLAMRRIQKYLRRYKARTPLKERRLYVLKRDIREYTDRIPLGDNSPLWKLLLKKNISRSLFQSIQNSLRVPLYSSEQKEEYCRCFGVPMGSHLTPWIANLYLEEFDQWIQAIDSDALYIRYGDDLLWISPHSEKAQQVSTEIPKKLLLLGLEVHPDKILDLSWSGSGSLGTSSFDYLGKKILWNQTIGISGKHRRDLLRIARRHFLSIKLQLKDFSSSERCGVLLNAVEDLFSKGWRGNPKFQSQVREIRNPIEIKSLRIDVLREAARIEFGSTHGYFIRKLKAP